MYCQADIVNTRLDLRQPSQNYLRAVLRSPPPHFSLEPFLATSKLNGKYHHGIHISSNNNRKGDCTSISSRRSLSEYDIWRSWEDCLWFQQSLEVEYEQAAREKKTRLMQGKGVKGFNGIYKQDMASSWESLPPGPNPDSVAQDIHQHLPILTRRGTFFRASQATINQRQAELFTLIEALFSDDMPALIKEIRASRIVSDFFGLWRRDYNFAEESQKLQKARTTPRNSVTSSVFSSYFSASHPTLPSSGTSPHNSPPQNPHKRSQPSTTLRPLSFSSSAEISEGPRYSCEPSRRSRSRPHSTSSDSSAHSDGSSDTSLSSTDDPAIVDDVPIVFGHNPSDPGDRSNSILEVLPEEQELFLKPSQVKPRPRASTVERKANRSYSLFGLPLNHSLLPEEKPGERSVRESWQTVTSQDSTTSDVLDGLGFTLPHQIKEQKFRASIASIATFLTTNSADAVIPRTPQAATAFQPYPCESSIRISTPLSLSDFDIYSDTDSILDAFPRPNSFIPVRPESRPDTPVDDLSTFDSPSSTRTTFNRPPSPACSALSSSAVSTKTSSTLVPDDSISIKAIHNCSIILLRVSRGITLADVKQRLYNKFIGQEGIPLSRTYDVAFVLPNPVPPTVARSQSASVTSVNRMDTQLITLESDWEQLTSNLQSNKITLRILDVPNTNTT